jgi:hypothetical protein
VIEWLPAASEEVVKPAVAPLRGTVPSVVAPSLNVTEPVGVPEPPDFETVAVKVTDCPTVLGLTEDVSVVLVDTAVPTVVDTVEALLAAFGSAVLLVAVAVLTRVVPPAAVTFAVSVSVCGEMVVTVPTVHTPVVELKLPWLGVALTNVSPAGSTSVTVTLAAASGPALLKVSV